jgi:tripeptidyl-peptidase I
VLVSIDGGGWPKESSILTVVWLLNVGVVQQQNQSFELNGESDLDLEYAMALTDPTPISLLQTGDLIEGLDLGNAIISVVNFGPELVGAGFDNWLDAVDKQFCTFEGGDDPSQVNTNLYSFLCHSPRISRTAFTPTLNLEVSIVRVHNDTVTLLCIWLFIVPESCGIIKPPNVVSISYGQDEATATVAYATRQCREYGKLGMMGTTILYSSGDNGVAGNSGTCLDANGKYFYSCAHENVTY